MGKKASHPLKVKQNPGKENKNLSKSDSYSDDYRLTPDFLLKELGRYCTDLNCCVDQNLCPRGEGCCSRETCLSPNRRSRRSPPAVSLSPCRRHLYEEPFYNDHESKRVRRKHKAPKDLPLLSKERHFTAREEEYSSFDCSSCESCDSCRSDTSSFSSPADTTDASFYNADPIPHRPVDYGRHPKPKPKSPERGRRSPPRNRGGSCAGDLFRIHNEDFYRWKEDAEKRNKNITKRAKSFSEENSFPGNFCRISAETRSRIIEDDKPKRRYKNARHRSDYVFSSQSPVRTNARASDSGVGKSCRTSRSSVTGGDRSHYCKSTEKRFDEERKHRKHKKDKDEEDASDQNQANLLNKMVNQTREHRKQIKTLESELERLRASGDALMSCEVNQVDVEWRPGDVLGEGSFSTVYRGTYCGTQVAVKELKFKLSQDDKNYFRSEAALLQQLHHPRIVLLMAVCTSSARPFMLLEYLSGGTLYTLIHQKSKGRLDHACYFSIAKDVAQGLNYLHKHDPQVLHLDLKSMNVLLDNYMRAKIADFGFSILRRPRGGSAVQKGSIRGTPAWMAPELLTKGEVSSKCDVYSYAIILWEMLTVSHPFHGLDIYQIMETVEEGIRLPLPQEGVSRELRELITSCWAQNPSLRPSFEEILGALESASLPVSWRKVLTKANISPSMLSDITTARAVIGMIEKSAELVEERRSPVFRKRSKSTETESELRENEKYRRRIVHKNRAYPKQEDSSASKAIQNRGVSPSRKNRHGPMKSARTSNNIYQSDGCSSARGISLPVEERRGREQQQQLHPNRKCINNNEGSRPVAAKSYRNGEQRRSRTRSSSRHRKKEADEKYLRRQDNGKHLRNGGGEQQRKENRDHNKRHSSPHKSKLDEGRCMVEESCKKNNYRKESSLSNSDSSSKDERLRKNQMSMSDSSIQSESCITVSKPYKRREKSSQHKRKPNSSSGRKPCARSPQRSPNRRSSPLVDVNDNRRLNSTHFQRGAGIALTAEQLLSQKQRLRPVRPSNLKDLSRLPQNSLNDISLILQQAMIQRRDALGKVQSTKGSLSILTKEYDWSDWF